MILIDARGYEGSGVTIIKTASHLLDSRSVLLRFRYGLGENKKAMRVFIIRKFRKFLRLHGNSNLAYVELYYDRNYFIIIERSISQEICLVIAVLYGGYSISSAAVILL